LAALWVGKDDQHEVDGRMAHPLHPDLMTPAERLAEIAEILAAGILRLRNRQTD
jgi:hypothetical protein